MNAETLRQVQAPLKSQYRAQPETACQTLTATASFAQHEIACDVATHTGPVRVGLHPATGGDGSLACSANMLLEALLGCAGITLRAVATAMEIPLRGATITAEGDLDFRGTLGVGKDAPVGLTAIRLHFALDTDASEEDIHKLLGITERYCVVYQTLRQPPRISVVHS